jgi:uncharacterized protein YggE
VAFAVALASGGTARAQPAPAPEPAIVATGEGVIQRAPDRAVVTVSVEGRAQSPRDAQQQAADRAAAVLARLAGAGIQKTAVKTVGYNLEQEFDFSGGQRVPRDFAARQTLAVTIDELSKVGDIVDAAVQAGATAINAVRFELRNRGEAENEALRLAVEDARRRAGAMAAAAGVTLGRILQIESAAEPGLPGPRPLSGAAMRAEAMQVTPIEPGSIDIRARVTLTVAIK